MFQPQRAAVERGWVTIPKAAAPAATLGFEAESVGIHKYRHREKTKAAMA